MGQISPAAINIIVLAVALLLYGLVWYATRNMSRFAQVLARLSPVGLVIPAMIYVSALTSHMVGKEAARPVQQPIIESAEKGRPTPRTSAPETEPAQKPAGPARPEAGPAQKSEEPPAPNARRSPRTPKPSRPTGTSCLCSTAPTVTVPIRPTASATARRAPSAWSSAAPS